MKHSLLILLTALLPVISDAQTRYDDVLSFDSETMEVKKQS